MASTLVCRYADIKSYGATWSLTSGTANSSFQLTNLNSPYADRVSKTTGTTATYRGTIASTAIQGIAIINCNLAGLTLTITNNNAMASQNLVIPAANADGLSLNGWVDLRAVTTAATQWNVAISGAAANIAIGKILLLGTLSAVGIRWDWRMKETTPAIVKRTSRQVAVGYPSGTRYRAATVSLMRESQRPTWANLRRGSVGPTQPCVFVPDSTVNDPLYGWFPDDSWDHMRVFTSVSTWTDTIEEMNPGVAL